MVDISKIATGIAGELKKGITGGVKFDEAKAAIRKAAEDTAAALNKESKEVLDALQAGNRDEVIKLTSAKDAFQKTAQETSNAAKQTAQLLQDTKDELAKTIKSSQEEISKLTGEKQNFANKLTETQENAQKATRELMKAKDELVSAKAVKTFNMPLPNGNTKTRLATNKGTSVQFEKTPDGKFVYHTAVKLDGTKYNSSYHDNGHIKKMNITDPEGRVRKTDFDFNGKRIDKPAKPEVINSVMSKDKSILAETLSDGTIKKTLFNDKQEPREITLQGADKKVISITTIESNGIVAVKSRQETIHPNGSKITINKMIKMTHPNGTTKLVTNDADQFGNTIVEYKFQKGSPIAKSKLTNKGDDYSGIIKEELHLRNGARAEMSNFNTRDYNYYIPRDVIITEKNGLTRKLQHDEIENWLKEIKHPWVTKSDPIKDDYYSMRCM